VNVVDRPHDLGGRLGFGPVPVAASRPWSAHWEQLAYVLASMTARAAGVNGDALRHVMETLPPEDYARLSPAGRWLRVAERCAVDGGLAGALEVADRAHRRANRLAPLDAGAYPEPDPVSRFVRPASAHNRCDPTDAGTARFVVGDGVVVGEPRPDGHTRLPGYLSGRRGEVVLLNGCWLLPDTHAHDGSETPTWVYAVRFRAGDLWPGAGSHTVCADLFEPYLEAADG
jgi:nitrile hydratase